MNQQMDLNAALVFVWVIQAGSFSRAARQNDMPVSTVSAKIAALEKSLGVSLIQRTTRRLRLTDAGEIFFQHALRAIGELQLAQSLTHETQEGIRGKIKMTAPVEVGMSSLADAISSFVAKNPDIHVELILTDRIVDLVAEGVDVALRFGDLKDSTLISKKIGSTCNHAFASPAYLKKAPPLRRPQQLADHSCLVFTNIFEGDWVLERGGPSAKDKVVQNVKVHGAFSANNLIAIHRLALDGRGVALLPEFLCREDVEKKRLVPVLEGWVTRRFPVHIVHPQQSFLPKSTRTLIDHVANSMGDVF